MDKKIVEIIGREDKKNPLSDTKIAELLNVSRATIVKMRKSLNIPDYSSRRLPFLERDIGRILGQDPHVATTDLTTMINDMGYEVSRFLIIKIKNRIQEIEEEPSSPDRIETDGIEGLDINGIAGNVIGSRGSLEMQINQSVAAVVYPPNGLHTLITGETGTGKSYLAELMYKVALETKKIKSDSNFVSLNCADYSHNPQLLLSQLFGYVKGAFTGADGDKPGLIEKADGGILFLDEIHRLPMEGQEILFSVMDHGKYRKLGQTDNYEDIRLMIIGATTKNINSSLLSTFRRRIPMAIEMPPLRDRPHDERYDIIVNFFKKESSRIERQIKVSTEIMTALLLYNCKGNIGQLKSDIQVACARAYLRYFNSLKDTIQLKISDFNLDVQKGILEKNDHYDRINSFISKNDLTVNPEDGNIKYLKRDVEEPLPGNIYSFMEERSSILRKQNIPEDLIFDVLRKEVELRIKRFIMRNEARDECSDLDKLRDLVGEDVVATVEDMIRIGEKHLGPLNKSMLYCMSMHLGESVKRTRGKTPEVNMGLKNLEEIYPIEFEVAEEMIKTAEERMNVRFSRDETGYIAMYLRNNAATTVRLKGKVRIIVVTHGRVAEEIAGLTNKMLGDETIEYINIGFDESPEEALERTMSLAERINENGILLLVDMGSALTYGELITKNTGIPTKTVARVDVAMTLEAATKASSGNYSLKEIFEMTERKNVFIGNAPRKSSDKRRKALLAMCITGYGAAIEIKRMIRDMVPEIVVRDIDIVPIGVIDESVEKSITDLGEDYDIIGVVGTVDPVIPDLKFYPLEMLFSKEGLSDFKDYIDRAAPGEKDDLKGLFNIENTFVKKIVGGDKGSIMKQMADNLYLRGYVKESFIENVMDRESRKSTKYKNSMAIPHAYPADILKPAVSVAVLDKAVDWGDGYSADIIFMLGLDYNNKDIIRYLYRKANDRKFLEDIRKADDEGSLIEIIMEDIDNPEDKHSNIKRDIQVEDEYKE